MSTSARRYVQGVALGGVLAVTLVVALLPTAVSDPWTLAVLGLLSLGAAVTPVRFLRGGGAQGFTLESGTFVALLLTQPLGLVPLIQTAASVAAHGFQSRSALKTAFNSGRTALETSAGTVAFWVIATRTPSATDARSVGAAVAGLVVFEVVSAMAMAELFHRLSGHPRLETVRDVVRYAVLTLTVNATFGVVLGTVAEVTAVVAAMSGVLMLGLYLGVRGYAAAVSGHRQASAINEFTHRLLQIRATPDGAPLLLPQLVSMFGGVTAELVVGQGDRYGAWRCHAGEVERTVAEGLPREGLMASAIVLGHGVAGKESLDRVRDGVAAPIYRGGEVSGALAIFERRGLEPWDESDASLLGAIANELSVALENVELFQEVERERVRLEAESAKLADIIGAASDGIALIRRDGTVDAWNPGMARITGVAVEDAVQRPWDQVLRLRTDENRELTGEADHAVTRALGGDVWSETLQLQALRRDGAWRRVACTSSVVLGEAGVVEGLVLVARDVTAERELETLKSEFIATVSHELRTPLTPLTGFLGTLRGQGHLLSDEQRTTIHDAMGKQLIRLETLIGDLLAVAELDHGDFDVETRTVDVAEVVQAAVLSEDPVERERVVLSETSCIALADPVALVRVVKSLVSNALKHTAGPVDVGIEAVDDHVAISVVDQGPGIASWEMQRIFRRFERLGNHLTRTQGPGLGLTIARSLARRMGGDVTVNSELGVGSTFVLTLPRARPRAVADPALDDATA